MLNALQDYMESRNELFRESGGSTKESQNSLENNLDKALQLELRESNSTRLICSNQVRRKSQSTKRVCLNDKLWPGIRRNQCRAQFRLRVMRPTILALITALALLTLIALAQQSFNQVEEEGRVDIKISDLDDVQVMRTKLSKLSNQNSAPAYQDVPTDEELNSASRFHRVAKGYLNHKKQSTIKSQINNSVKLNNSSVSNQQAINVTQQEQVSSTPIVDTDSTSINVDKIKGIDLSLVEIKRMSQENGGKRINYDYTNAKCHKNKYDRIIAQRINLKDISRPIVTSESKFLNPFSTWKPITYMDLIKFVMFENDESNIPDDKEELDRELPMIKPDFELIEEEAGQTDFHVTWIGHSTLLIKVDGLNILTDPMFSQRASPNQYFGPQRFRDPACRIHSLPNINIVLISHNHYDHLDADSVKELNDRFGTECRWIVPLGLGEFLETMNVKNYVELDWWQKDCFHVGNIPISVKENVLTLAKMISPLKSNLTEPSSQNTTELNLSNTFMALSRAARTNRLDLDIYFTPSQHWSRRAVSDVNKSLWGSFTIVSASGSTFFFGGDTGYCSAFKEIGKIFGPLTGAAIPIGAYKPRWFMKYSHVNPSEAVQIHRDLKSVKSIAIHHATFSLANEHYKEPAKLLNEIMRDMNSTGSIKEPFIVLKHGESAEFCKSCSSVNST